MKDEEYVQKWHLRYTTSDISKTKQLVREPSAIQLAMCAQEVWGLERVAGGRGTWEWAFLSSGIMGCTRGRHSKCPKFWL